MLGLRHGKFVRHPELFNAAPPASRIREYIAISNRETKVESSCVCGWFGYHAITGCIRQDLNCAARKTLKTSSDTPLDLVSLSRLECLVLLILGLEGLFDVPSTVSGWPLLNHVNIRECMAFLSSV
jgi:hypothetical protein